MTGSLEEFNAALGGKVIDETVTQSGALSITQVLATRSWFDARRRRLTSSGGRPTDANWTLKRQVPFAIETWDCLKTLAEQWSETGPKLGPGQVAAFILEDSLLPQRQQEMELDWVDPVVEPPLREWAAPPLFFGKQAA